MYVICMVAEDDKDGKVNVIRHTPEQDLTEEELEKYKDYYTPKEKK